MSAPSGGVDLTQVGVLGGAVGTFLASVVLSFVAYWRSRKKPAAPAGPERLVAAAIGIPGALATDVGVIKEAVARMEARDELRSKADSEIDAELRELRRDIAERDLQRTLDQTQVLTALGRVEAALARMGGGRRA